jgi:hypothetical protein
MNTIATTPTKIDYLYVKDLPDAGGLRSVRMKQLRDEIERLQRAGAARAIVRQADGGSLLFGSIPIDRGVKPSMTDAVNVDPSLREVYDLTRDLEPQFAQHRARNW